MKRIVILGLMAIACLSMQAQKKVTVLAQNVGPYVPTPEAVTEVGTNQTIIPWHRTEKDDWFEQSNLMFKKVPTVTDEEFDRIFPLFVDPIEGYTPMPWRLTEENGETVLHCYLRMPGNVVSNFWLTDEEGCILDLETGISYRARRTEPDCYRKRFSFKARPGSLIDFKIFFPKLPETTKSIAIYGVPNWQLRGQEMFIDRELFEKGFGGTTTMHWDREPVFHHPTLVTEAKNYDKDNFYTWAEYKDVHLIKPVEEGTMAMWLTPEAAYLAISTEMNWRREYFGCDGNIFLLDNLGNQYKCTDVLDFPDDTYFWVQGMSGDYFAMVLVFEPILPAATIETITYIKPEGEPFNANFANWSGNVKSNLSIKQLRKNQHLFEYFPRKVVE